MKKLVLFVLLVTTTKISLSQIDMITALKTIGEDVVYTEYLFVTIKPGSKNEISQKRYKANLKLEKNRFGKVVGFNALEIDKKNGEEHGIKYNYMYNKFDNYTHPSYAEASASHAYAIINGVIFYLEHFENINSFDIAQVWIPTIPKPRSSEAVFQGGKMSDLQSADLMKLVKDYFIEMKKIQEANPYNESEQMEADAMKFTLDSTNIMIRQGNADYWNSEAGQKKLAQMRQPRIMLTNDTGADFCLCHGQGVSTVLKPGEKKEFGCRDGKVYLGEKVPNSTNLKQTNKLLLDLNGTNCGAKINASTL